MSFREYRVTDEAVVRGREIGLYGATANRLSRAARRSAQYTGALGNRRFQDLVLTIEGDAVVWVNRLPLADAA
jgi:hypothetical protein